MAWIGLTDQAEGRFARAKTPEASHQVLTQGTLLIETHVSADRRPQVLFEFDRDEPLPRGLAVRAVPGRGISIVHRNHDRVCHGALGWPGAGRMDIVRISYAWDLARRWARLTVEAPDEGAITSTPVADPLPLSRSDLRELMLGRDRTLCSDVAFAAVSDRIEPIGQMPTLHPTCPIATPFGMCAVGDLRRGDLVLTESGQSVPVLHRIDYTVPARGGFAPVRLRAPYFGLRQDIVVAPDQRLVLRGSEVEYLFGKEAVLVPVRHLGATFSTRIEVPESTIRYCQLLLPGHEVLNAGGALVESLFVGRLRRKPEALAASLLAGLPRRGLPEHAQPAYQALRAFESNTLVEQRAA